MNNFSKKAKSVKFFDFKVKNINYKLTPKIYLIDDNLRDYLCYIDPDEASPNFLIFVLSGPKDITVKYEDSFKKFY